MCNWEWPTPTYWMERAVFFQAEFFEIIKAAELIIPEPVFFLDCQAALKAVEC